MKILLLGKNGQLGKELDRNLAQIGNLTSLCPFGCRYNAL